MKPMRKGVILLAFFLSVAYLYAMDLNSGDGKKGKELYREVCKSCHDGSKAKKITPMHKTMAQWKRLFDNDMAKLREKHPNNDLFQKYSEKDFENIYRFVQDGALDSEQPQTCD